MPADIPSIEPTEVIAGNTVAWTKDLSDYPAPTWTLSYYLRGPADIDIVAGASGATHSVSKTAAQTTPWASGIYHWRSFVASGSQRYFVAEGDIVIHENPASSKRTFDTRSKAKQILDALVTTMLDNAGRPEQQYRIEAAGRLHVFQTYADLITAIDYWKAEVLREEKAKKIARGEGPGNRVLLRFR